ncbi:MAG: hypothetical protein EA344_00835 [Alkalicoccus sp.]|nr:MAG: hypothetical protein EA344_00835 [Alkalicoccus sp.]
MKEIPSYFYRKLQEPRGDSEAMKAGSHSDRRKRKESAEAGPLGKPQGGRFSRPYFIFKAAFYL